MADLRKLKDQAAEHMARGRFARAAEALEAVVKADPRDIASRQKLGDALRKAGEAAQARRTYEDVAGRYARDGQLIKAIAICKIVLELDPGHEATQRMLADLYARRRGGAKAPAAAAPAEEQERVVELPLAAPTATPTGTETPIPAPTSTCFHLGDAATPFEAIVEAARAEADEGVALVIGEPEDLAPSGVAPAAPAIDLPRIPLFSDLPHEAFVKLAERVSLHRVPAGTAIVREGEEGASFFVVASGVVRVEKAGAAGDPVTLARLPEGAFFGEMAILSGEPRAATVLADGPCELLEIRADVLLELAREHPPIVESLATFYRRRLLANAMATSPLFRPFGRDERAALMGRFRSREVAEGTAVIREGQPADGLYVVLSGTLDVWKRRDGEQVRAGQLREGDVFGEMSCLRKGPASASVSAARKAVLLRLPRADFDELVMTYPQILELVSELSDERQHGLEAVAGGRAAFDDEGILLT
jgi:CRP-like cAMP-binding protein